MINRLRNFDERIMEAMAGAEQGARASQISDLRGMWSQYGPDSKNHQMDVVQRSGGDYRDPQQLEAARMAMVNADSGAADQLYADAIAGTPRGLVGNVAAGLAADNMAGGLARGTVFGGGAVAAGTAMTAGAQKLAAIMGLLGEADEVEVARDQELRS